MADGQPRCWLADGGDRPTGRPLFPSTIRESILASATDSDSRDSQDGGDDTTDEPDVPADVASVAAGGTLYDGDYAISFNDDSEGRWYLRYDDGAVEWCSSFLRVDGLGNDEWGLKDESRGLALWIRLADAAPRIDAILAALARGDPDA